MSGYRRRGVLIATLLGFFIVVLDTMAVNVALTRVDGDLGTLIASLQWVVDAYALTFAALQLSTGAACDRLGARSIHLLGLVVFGLLSAVCALAPVSGALITFYALQGVGAATIIPASLTMLLLIRDRPADQVQAIDLQGGAGSVAVAIGSVAGRLFVTFTGWRFVLWMNLPLVAAALWLTARRLPTLETRSLRQHEGNGLPGQVLSVAGLTATAYGIIAAGEHGWSSPVVTSTLAGLGLLAVFVLVKRTASRPILPTAVFFRPRFAVATAVGFTLDTGLFGQLFVLALFLQRYLGYEPWLTGLALVPQACSTVVTPPMGGRATVRIRAFPTMLMGLSTGAAGFAGLAVVTASTSYPLVAALAFLDGLDTALIVPAAASVAVASAPAGCTDVAGSIVNTARQTDSVIGVTALDSLIALGDFLTGFHRAVVGASAVFTVAATPVAVVVLRAVGHPGHVDAP